MAPWPLSVEGVMGAVEAALEAGRREPGSGGPEGWDGKAAERIVVELADQLASEADAPPEADPPR